MVPAAGGMVKNHDFLNLFRDFFVSLQRIFSIRRLPMKPIPLLVKVGDFLYLCSGFINNKMYTEKEVRMADAAIRCLKDGVRDQRTVLYAMGVLDHECYAMLRALTDDLKLLSKGYDSYTLTFEGRRAANMGFKAYVEEQERKTNGGVQEVHPWYIPDKKGLIQSIIASVAGAIVGALVSWLLMR